MPEKTKESDEKKQTVLLYDTREEERDYIQNKITKPSEFTHVDKLIEKRITGINTEFKNIPTSIFPSIFARPLMFTYGLLEEKNESIINEWKGLLGIFALADHLYLDIKVKKFDLNLMLQTENNEPYRRFLKVLNDMKPKRIDNLIIKIIYVNNNLVGGTFPGCLFFTAPEYKLPESIGWKNENGKLIDPVDYFVKNLTNERERKEILSKLKTWIDNIIKEIGKRLNELRKDPYLIDNKYPDLLSEILTKWKDKLINYPGDIPQEDLYNLINGEPELAFEEENDLYKIFLRKIKSQYSEAYLSEMSEVAIDSSLLRSKKKTLLALSKEILDSDPPKKIWGLLMSNSLNYEQLESIKLRENKPVFPKLKNINIEYINLDDLWTDKIIKTDLSESVYKISIKKQNGEEITFVPPLKKEILYIYTPEEIVNNKEGEEPILTAEYDERHNTIICKLVIKTHGRRKVELTKKYSLNETDKEVYSFGDAVRVTSFLIWPNFVYEKWKNYYVYLEKMGAYRDMKFSVFSFTTEIKERDIPIEEVIRFTSVPSAIVCYLPKDERTKLQCGLIIPKLKEINIDRKNEKKLLVSIDFGTSNTAVFSKENDREPTNMILKNMNLSIFYEPAPYIEKPYQIFLPLMDIKDPFATLLNEKRKNIAKYTPIVDTNIFFENIRHYLPHKEVRENIKWEDEKLANSFIKQLLIMIAAQVLEGRKSNLEIRVCFPASFHPNRRTSFGKAWAKIVEEVTTETGIKVDCVFKNLESDIQGEREEAEKKLKFLTESLANNTYFLKKYEMKYATAFNNLLSTVDLGGGSSDISFWYRKEGEEKIYLYTSSVKIGGVDIAKFTLDKGLDFYNAIEFSRDNSSIERIKEDVNPPNGKISPFNFILRYYEKNPEANKMKIDMNRKSVKEVNSRILSLVGGVLYYVGMLQTKAIDKNLERISVALSGNGFKLLNISDINIEYRKKMFKEFLKAGFLKAQKEMEGISDINIDEIPIEIVTPDRISEYKETVGKGLLYLDMNNDLKEEFYKTKPEESIDIIAEKGVYNTNRKNKKTIPWNQEILNITNLAEIKIEPDEIVFFKDFLNKLEETAQNKEYELIFSKELSDLVKNTIKNLPDICYKVQKDFWNQYKMKIQALDPIFILLLKEMISF